MIIYFLAHIMMFTTTLQNFKMKYNLYMEKIDKLF